MDDNCSTSVYDSLLREFNDSKSRVEKKMFFLCFTA